MKANILVILEECIERGIKTGWHRSHKHDANPSEEIVSEKITDSIMEYIHEYFTFDN